MRINSTQHRQSRLTGPKPDGFTLVELLAVIGIIALLLGILLPSLAAARRAAQRTACLVKLQQMMVAAQLHATDHQGYFPLVGILGHLDPASLGDSQAVRYDYYHFQAYPTNYLLAPITLGLAKEMAVGHALSTIDDVGLAAVARDPSSDFMRNFICPSQSVGSGGIAAAGLYSGSINDYDVFCMQSQSYIFNEAVLGYDDGFGRLRGRLAAIHQPANTFFAADGGGGWVGTGRTTSWEKDDSAADGAVSMATVYNNRPYGPVTLGDAFGFRYFQGTLLAGDTGNFDLNRHQKKLNVAFCDGHVETRYLSSPGLLSAYVLAP